MSEENPMTNDLEQRRMVADSSKVAADAVECVVDILGVMTRMGLTPEQILDAIMHRMDVRVAEQIQPLASVAVATHAWLYQGADPGMSGMVGGMQMFRDQLDNRHSDMKRILDRLFAEAPKLENPDGSPVEGQAPAIPEIAIHLASGHVIQGVLSVTPEGPYKMMSVAMQGHTRIMLESFFKLDDIDCIAVARRTESNPHPIIVGGS